MDSKQEIARDMADDFDAVINLLCTNINRRHYMGISNSNDINPVTLKPYDTVLVMNGVPYSSALEYAYAVEKGLHEENVKIHADKKPLSSNKESVEATKNIGTMVRKDSVLAQAQDIIYGDREQTYGSPDKNLKLIAAYWTEHLNAAKRTKIELSIDDVCVMMMLLKTARLANTPKHTDSLVDICGYAALADRCNAMKAVDTKTQV